MGLEEDLLGALKFAKFGGKMPANAMVRELVKNVQLGALKRLREDLDKMINELSKQGAGTKGAGGLDPYEILGVRYNATKEEVDRAYRGASRKAHPDRGGTHDDMVKVNAAYEAIYRFRGWSK